MHQPVLFFLLLFFTITFVSCGPDYAYKKSFEIGDQAWAYADTLDFDFRIEDTTLIYNLYLEVEHTRDYGFQNLYTRIHTRFPDGARLSELLSLELADKTGFWLGDCRGEICTLRIPIQEGAYFNQAGAYTIQLEQYMRVDPLPGVRAMALLLENTGRQRILGGS